VRAVNDFNNGTDIKYSHTDVGGRFNLQTLAHGITFQFETGGYFRVDNEPSIFFSKTGLKVRKRRNDIGFDVKPNATISLLSELHLNAYYQFSRVFSRMGPEDYSDFNILNHTLGLVLFTEFSNY